MYLSRAYSEISDDFSQRNQLRVTRRMGDIPLKVCESRPGTAELSVDQAAVTDFFQIIPANEDTLTASQGFLELLSRNVNKFQISQDS